MKKVLKGLVIALILSNQAFSADEAIEKKCSKKIAYSNEVGAGSGLIGLVAVGIVMGTTFIYNAVVGSDDECKKDIKENKNELPH
ncbi:MAG: hypothetical protein PHW64_05685 [Sulfuricurvum sp.]|nr:hypothetical protein [Sulfuricurvum sp.]